MFSKLPVQQNANFGSQKNKLRPRTDTCCAFDNFLGQPCRFFTVTYFANKEVDINESMLNFGMGNVGLYRRKNELLLHLKERKQEILFGKLTD